MNDKERKVPRTRIGRFAHMARLAGGVAGGMIAEGGRRLASGEVPRARDVLVTPANARRVADELAQLRGAAMKVGQLLSMDGGDLLPPALAEILARLRQDAPPIPERQLREVLDGAWGRDWQRHFREFAWRPIAAASIGQVHRAVRHDGRELAIKVQYPGIREGIDSDVDNVMTLLRLSQLLPEGMQLQPLLEEAKIELHAEADYRKEAQHLKRYGELLAGDPDFQVPEVDTELSGETVLAMTLVRGEPVDRLVGADQATRDRACALLIGLLFRELFEFQLVQTDPNFANFLYDEEQQRVVLLDFGATRHYSRKVVAGYKALFKAAFAADRERLAKAAQRIGYFADEIAEEHRDAVIELFILATEPLRHEGVYDFAESTLSGRIAEAGLDLSFKRGYWHTPPADSLFLHRKLGGLYLLAARLGARLDIAGLLRPWVSTSPSSRRGA
jgi:predicted unusual protein kinase regulating ubiquinone biosynthesis (AarF/ABC1/UbiB family)